MLDVARQAGRLPEVVAAAEKAVQHMIDHYLSPYGADVLCVVDAGKIKLGGNGLALLALAELNVLRNDAKYSQLGHRLASYIAAQQRPDGDFVHSRSKDKKGNAWNAESQGKSKSAGANGAKTQFVVSD